MASVRQKGTKPEMTLRRALHAAGLRYRVNVKSLPGSPDLVFPKYKAVIFVHGCFWHAHEGCKYATSPITRSDFWEEKFRANRIRDLRNISILVNNGWKVLTLWECEFKGKTLSLDCIVTRVVKWIHTEP
jgi:DNA mismatch endonuclease (patch repair protein)